MHIDNLFTRFYQKDEFAEGAGVGLSLVRELVQLYHGEISVHLEQKNIINFLVTLPINQDSFDKETYNNISSQISKQPDVISEVLVEKQEDIELPILLIVEDHEEVRRFIMLALKHKYQIFQAGKRKTRY